MVILNFNILKLIWFRAFCRLQKVYDKYFCSHPWEEILKQTLQVGFENMLVDKKYFSKYQANFEQFSMLL